MRVQAAGEKPNRTRALSGVSQERTSTGGLITSSFESLFSSFLALTKQKNDAFSSPSRLLLGGVQHAPERRARSRSFLLNDINEVASRQLDG